MGTEVADEKVLTTTTARYGRVDLLCIDELSYMELDRHGAELLFQVSHRKGPLSWLILDNAWPRRWKERVKMKRPQRSEDERS
ncbi:ATP-binding protein [Nonomuraea jabiensis]|uniref:ATP-binding protein n=1 Tax=Nonomuraea jabiensis TaxID=882448 RepID=UPI003D706D0A